MPESDERSGIEAMDKLFCKVDFAAENEGLDERLRERIFEHLMRIDEERELTGEELSGLAAAGTGADGMAEQPALTKWQTSI